MAKAFLIDVTACTGCYACQIGCKDEHCDQAWLPYAEAQPEVGQFWLKMTEKERGANGHVRVAYVPVLGGQNAEIREFAPEVLMDREDGLIVIDPAKAAGRKDIAEKFEGVYWNEALQLPQACTGCAHLLDDPESPIRVPRCVDNCAVGAIQFGEVEELDLEGAEGGPIVWYK
ncbi:MAG: oxidoreductase, partial [Eggerthellaceae bacterium]|nr:oxidoreductase [Eggerthellaceae bacterium]